MRRPGTFATLTASAWALFAGAVIAQSPATPAPPPSAELSVKTRLITLDVVATDSHGRSVAELKASDFQLFDNRDGPQKIARFEYIDRSASAPSGTAAEQTAATYSNQTYAQLAIPPTVLLVDALNIGFFNRQEAHRQAFRLLDRLPRDTPVAIFLFTRSLTVVQGFTTDRALLRRGIDRGFATSLPKLQNPQEDPDSAANQASPRHRERSAQDEKREYTDELTMLADQNADAMMAIANYLKGYPGRKNLVWFSEAFPIWIQPGADFDGHIDQELASYTRDTFGASASFEPQVRSATEALTDARVLIFPVDPRGLEVSALYAASQDPPAMKSGDPNDATNAGALMGAQLVREDAERDSSQATMEKMAEDTGGVPCRNTNDMSGCVAAALKNSSSYYDISYYPENIRWDGRFHEITVKTTARGVKLRFRRGYFATDTAGPANQQPGQLLRAACSSQLPVPSIPLTAQAIRPAKAAGREPTRYLLTVSASGISLSPGAGSRAINLQSAVCEYDPKGATFRMYERDISQAAPAGNSAQARDVRSVVVFAAKPETRHIRLAVLDPATGLTGSVDVPAHPRDFITLSAPIVADGSEPTANSAVPGTLFTHLAFRSSSGKSSALDSNGGELSYVGDLDAERAAPAFFHDMYGRQFHCEAGELISNDPASTVTPSFRFAFHSPASISVVVDLAGDQPAYSGDLPVDARAKAFFGDLWKLCHCRQP